MECEFSNLKAASNRVFQKLSKRKLKLSLISYWSYITLSSDKAKEKTETIGGHLHLGKVKTEQVKRIGKELMSRFPTKFTANFEENKQTVETLTEGLTTKIRNKVAGYITHTVSITQTDSQPETDEEDI